MFDSTLIANQSMLVAFVITILAQTIVGINGRRERNGEINGTFDKSHKIRSFSNIELIFFKILIENFYGYFYIIDIIKSFANYYINFYFVNDILRFLITL